MKKFLSIVFIMVSMHLFAQTNPITAITISLPANPDANTANWGMGTSTLLITASSQTATGRIDPAVQDSKILVIVKQNGNKVCGSYTSSSAPDADFNTVTKVWSGINAASLLGKGCILSPGDYELSVQFFGYSNGKTIPLSDEKTKPFTIKGNDQQAYQASQAISPADGTVFNENDIKKPITFRWTPVIPKPQGTVTYRLSVWQLMQGQTGPQAIKANSPILKKDVDNITQAIITNLVTGPCKPPYLCDFFWSVQALTRDGKPIGGNNGTSNVNELSVYYGNVYGDASPVKPGLPANGTIIKVGELPQFTWKGGNSKYKLRIVEITGNQTPEEAFRTNKPFFEKDSLKELSFKYPASGPKFTIGKTYAWSIFDRWGNLMVQNNPDPVVTFTVGGCDVHLDMALQSVECISTTNGISKYKVCVAATYTGSAYNLTYANAGSGFTAYAPAYTPVYTVSNVTPALQVQNSGASTTVNYCLDVSVPAGQTSMVVGLQGDDKDPGPLTCQAAASVVVRLPQCTTTTCNCGSWGTLTIDERTYQNGQNFVDWDCGVPVRFSSSYQCSGSNCQAVTSWVIQKDGVTIQTGNSGNNLADNFTPTANGTYTVTINATCGGVRCMPLTFTLHEYNCVSCNCGTWGPLVIPGAAGNTSYKCGTQIPWNCGQPFSFTSTYQCSSANCQAATTWEVVQGGAVIKSGTGTNTLAGSFTPTANGTYTINLSAICGGLKCPICSYTVVIANCLSCDCGTWGPLVIPLTAGRLDKSTITSSTSYKCGSSIPWNCNQPLNFTSTYQCSSANCQATTAWEVVQGGAVLKSGTGTANIAGGFTPTANGTYTINLSAVCGGIKCPVCSYTVVVTNCITCDCGTWGPLVIPLTAGRLDKSTIMAGNSYKCGSTIPWSCKQPFNFTSTYQCSTSAAQPCRAVTSWQVTLGGAVVGSGSGTANLTGAFTPTANGVYTVTLSAECGGIKCLPCTYTVTVRNCVDCNCGHWAFLLVNRTLKYECGSKDIAWKCGQAINFSDTYFCSPTGDNCKATTGYTIAKDGALIETNTGSNAISGSFTPTTNGSYTITLYSDCNGLKCPPCTYTFVVTNCVTCDCGAWASLAVPTAAGNSSYKCGSIIPWSCKQPFNFSNSYTCFSTGQAPCRTVTAWQVALNGGVVASGTGVGRMAGGFLPTANGTYTLTLSADCGGIKCPPCTYSIIVTNCVTCDCGSWDPLIVNRETKYKCGSEIPWKCSQPFSFTDTYHCSSTGENCVAKTSWVIKNGDAVIQTGTNANNVAGSFTPTTNGTYTITLSAVCNDIKCPQCTYTIVVTNCVTCNCGHWAFLLVNRTLKYECGSKDIAWKCGQVINFSDTYFCSPTGDNCKATTGYTIAKDGALIETNTGTNAISGSFTPTANGTYTITLYSDCNGLKCPPCTYTFVVTDCITCNCGTWTPLTITGAAGNVDYKCGSAIQWSCNQPLNFGAGYECTGGARSCVASISWNIKKDGVTVQTNTTSSNSIHGSFTPTASGTYTITLNAVCNGVQCAPCVYTVVTNCISCNCGSWDPMIVNRSIKYECGSKQVTPWKCGQPFSFTDTYHCSSTGENCVAKTSWVIKNGDAVIQTGTNANSVAGSFTPTTNGTYTITLSAVCNDIKCPPCTYTISVTDCITCNCGSWGSLVIPGTGGRLDKSTITASTSYKCGSTIQAACSQPFNFTDSYQCSSNDKTCLAAITYEVKLNGTVVKTGVGNGNVSGTFTPTGNGTYTITLSATCNGVTCQPCGYNVVVANCCDCGNWNNIVVNGNKGYPCDSHIPWTLNTPFSFRDTYTSSPNGGNCVAVTSWDVTRNGVLVTSGTGTAGIVSGSFTPTISGSTYVLTEHATCNGKICTVCTMSILTPADPCPVLCNGGFETIINGAAPTHNNPAVQIDEGDVSCWATTEADKEIEIWKSGDSYITAYEGSYFAEISATARGTLYQSFTTVSAKYVVVSFAHRGRYNGPDTMKVSLDHGSVSLALGTFSATDTGWTYHSLPAQSLAAGTTYTLKFTSISSDGGKGPPDGGNFIDAISISCVDVLPNTNTTTTTQKMKQLKKPLRSNKVKR